MKPHLTIAIINFFMLSGMAQSQNWRPVRIDGVYMFDIGQEYRALRIDSTNQEADTIHLFGFNEINYNQDTRCYNPKGAPWFGKEIINYPDCTVIKNRFNESLVFPMNPPNEWLFFVNESDTVKATVIEEKEFTFLGITDSIRIIQLDDGNESYLPNEIWISKNYGMIKTYNLSTYSHSFYDDYDYNFEAALAGIEKEQIGIQNLSSKEIFDFMPGDELHILDYRWCVGEQAHYSKSIISILERNETADTIRYEMQTCTSYGSNPKSWVIPKNSVFDIPPYAPIYSSYQFTCGIMGENKFGLVKGYSSGFFNQESSDSCYSFIHYDKKKSGSNNPIAPSGYFLKGLGGPYHYFYGAMCQSSNELVYYKKGSTEWGTPYNCDSLVGISENPLKYTANVYPNPATDFIQVELSFVGNELSVTLFNYLGQELFTSILSEKVNNIPISELAKGLHFYRIKHSGTIVKTGTFIKD